MVAIGAKVIVTITGDNQASAPLSLGGDGAIIMISDDDSFDGTLTVQYISDEFNQWVDDVKYSGPVVDRVKAGTEFSIRIGCKTGDYVSGSIKAVIYRGYMSASTDLPI
jgi:hypothetical protein